LHEGLGYQGAVVFVVLDDLLVQPDGLVEVSFCAFFDQPLLEEVVAALGKSTLPAEKNEGKKRCDDCVSVHDKSPFYKNTVTGFP
jgi:hypothetical protein